MDSSSRIEETTPLLSRATGQITTRYKKNSSKLIYGYVLGVLFAFMALIYSIRSNLPTPLSDVEAREKNGFAGIHCYNEYLSHFNAPHSANQRENGYLKDWIVKLAHEFKAEANNNGIEMDIIDQDPTDIVTKRNKFNTGKYWLVESRNVMIRLVGQSNNKNKSFLVNAHYDSVSTSHGVTDNGMGTAVALELLRYFVQHPFKNIVIFLFNNFEEGGLIGADAFVLHPWFSTIKLFVNLEGTGAGGRAILLCSNILSAVQGLASSNAGYLHASPLGKDLLNAKLLKSDTDYTVFSKYGVPGLDISFYYPRSHYHTQRDDLAHTTPQSLQHMGQMALGSVLSIDQIESIIQKAGKPEPIIYYDILGRVMLVYSFFTCQLLNVLSLVLIPLGLLTWFWFSTDNGGHVDAKRVALKHNLWLIGQGLLSTLVALVSMVVFVAFFSWILMLINPSATYGSTYSVTVYLFAVSFLGLVLSQWILTKHSFMLEESLNTTQVGFYGLTTFWWLLLLAATILATQKMATTYFAIYFFISSSLATVLLTGTMPSKTEEGSDVAINGSRYWSLAFLIQVLLPGTLLTEFLFLVIDSMRHTSADGTPEWAIYGLLATPIVLIVLHLLPWAQAAGELRTTTFCASIVLIVLHLLPWAQAAGELRTTTFCASIVFVVIMMVCFIASHLRPICISSKGEKLLRKFSSA
ncbi:uncharacterized protein B0P05DRAFT_307690 [Gilbertella persicaria]|uniref:uncharacterized protein n=1 Tax=Gilbertella persicaria TaxID=101096 RepID=UPI00221F2CF1|nr:uncharacterized protein B0P05DRAFT_307690 [Gilbertella persicaria]KAI8053141.1 hypothetical protein B0P05DRAFT_307690 [Gilbertella persicaria]